MRLSRRQLLVLAALPPAVAALGAGAVGVRWWDQPADQGFDHLSPDEAAFVRALAGASWPATTACPLDGQDAALDHFMDASMGTLAATPRKAARLGLHALDAMCLPTHGGVFSALPLAERQDVVHRWLDSELMPLRAAILSTVLVLGMGYTIHPTAAPVFGSLYGCRYGP